MMWLGRGETGAKPSRGQCLREGRKRRDKKSRASDGGVASGEQLCSSPPRPALRDKEEHEMVRLGLIEQRSLLDSLLLYLSGKWTSGKCAVPCVCVCVCLSYACSHGHTCKWAYCRQMVSLEWLKRADEQKQWDRRAAIFHQFVYRLVIFFNNLFDFVSLPASGWAFSLCLSRFWEQGMSS